MPTRLILSVGGIVASASDFCWIDTSISAQRWNEPLHCDVTTTSRRDVRQPFCVPSSNARLFNHDLLAQFVTAELSNIEKLFVQFGRTVVQLGIFAINLCCTVLISNAIVRSSKKSKLNALLRRQSRQSLTSRNGGLCPFVQSRSVAI